MAQEGDGEGEGGEDEVDGVHHGQDQEKTVERLLVFQVSKIENTFDTTDGSEPEFEIVENISL